MRNNIKRIFVSFVAAATIFTISGTALAEKITVNMPYSIYETKEKNNISSGVIHEKIMRFTTVGWWNINVLRVNLNDPYTEIKGLINTNGIPGRDKVSSMVEKHNAVAAINGDFFNYSPLPSAMGALINNGEMISSPIEKAYALPTFFVNFLNKAQIDYMDRNMVALNKISGKSVNINTINKVTKDFDTLTLLNKHWGSKSIGNRFHNDLIEVIVEKGIVKDVRIGMEAVEIPKDGYVLAVRGDRNQGLHNFKIGDVVELDVSTTPDINDIKFAIGGGSIILKNGELSLTNINIKGNEPRTGIGISKDGSQIILVTIDGRDASFKGVSQEMFGAILRDLGAYNALNLDGGGSTAMAIKPIDDKKATLVNKPSDGGERLIVNSVGIFSKAPIGELSYIKISTDDLNMFVNTTRRFTVKGFDKYHNPVTIDQSNLVYSHEGKKGSIVDNAFKAESSGKATITAKYNDIVSSIDINILGPVKDLTTNLSNFSMDINSERKLPVFFGKDAHGFQAKVYPEDITFSTINEIGYVIDNVFYSEKNSVAGILTAKIGDGLENIRVAVGNEGKLIEGFETLDNLSFTSYPATVLGEIKLSSEAKEGKSSVSLKYDFSNGDNTRAAYLNLMNGENLGLAIEGIPRKLGLWVNGDSSGSWVRGALKDSKGTTHTIDFAKAVDWTGWQFVTANIPANVTYPIVLERIYAVEIDSLRKQSGELLFDGLTAFYPPTLGNIVLPNPSTLKDDKNIKEKVKKDGFSFAIVSDPVGLNELVKYDAISKIKTRLSKNKIGILLNGISEEFRKDLKNYAIIDASGNYSKNKHYDVFFLHVNTEKGGIRATNSQQWDKLKADLKSRPENNIVLFLSSPVFESGGFTDPLEADLLHKYLVEAREKGKNIFVVHGGNSNTLDLKDGIRYIGLNTKALTQPEDIYDLSIIEFVVNGSNMTYDINPLFEKPAVKVGK